MAYSTRERTPWPTSSHGISYAEFIKYLSSNNKSDKHEKQLTSINNIILKVKNILLELNGENGDKFNKLIDDKSKKILEENTLIEKTVKQIEILNLLLKSLEKSSKLNFTTTNHLILSQSAYECLKEAYPDNTNDIERNNELMRLKDNRLIQIKEGSSYFAAFNDSNMPPYSTHIPSKILEIVNIPVMKDDINNKIDKYNKDIINPWMKEVLLLITFIESTEKGQNTIKDVEANKPITLVYFDKDGAIHKVNQSSSEDLLPFINGTSVNSIEQTLSNEDTPSITYSNNVKL